MAIKKTFEAASGISGDYWKITKIIAHRILKKTEIELHLFKDAGAAAAGKAPIAGAAKKTVWRADENADGATVAACYEAVKKQAIDKDSQDDFFAGAEDV